MGLPKKIDKHLLSNSLLELINASTKIFPVSYNDIVTDSNPNNYEFVRITDGPYKNTICIWNKEKLVWEVIGADDFNIEWEDIKNIPAVFKPMEHTHDSSDIEGIDERVDSIKDELLLSFATKEEVNNKVDKEEGKGLSEENFTSELKLKLLALSEEAEVDYAYMAQLLQNHMENTDVHLTSAMKDLINSISGKVNTSTFEGHVNNTNVHVTQEEKNTWSTVESKVSQDEMQQMMLQILGSVNEIVGSVQDEVSNHKAEKATQDGLGHITLDDIPDVSGKMDKSGGDFTGIVKAYPNTSYTVAQIRNIILSPNDADVNAMNNGEIWIKYK